MNVFSSPILLLSVSQTRSQKHGPEIMAEDALHLLHTSWAVMREAEPFVCQNNKPPVFRAHVHRWILLDNCLCHCLFCFLFFLFLFFSVTVGKWQAVLLAIKGWLSMLCSNISRKLLLDCDAANIKAPLWVNVWLSTVFCCSAAAEFSNKTREADKLVLLKKKKEWTKACTLKTFTHQLC